MNGTQGAVRLFSMATRSCLVASTLLYRAYWRMIYLPETLKMSEARKRDAVREAKKARKAMDQVEDSD